MHIKLSAIILMRMNPVVVYSWYTLKEKNEDPIYEVLHWGCFRNHNALASPEHVFQSAPRRSGARHKYSIIAACLLAEPY